jgi:hypothetical protein
MLLGPEIGSPFESDQRKIYLERRIALDVPTVPTLEDRP